MSLMKTGTNLGGSATIDARGTARVRTGGVGWGGVVGLFYLNRIAVSVVFWVFI